MPGEQLYVLYKTPNERRLELVCGYVLGLAIAVAVKFFAPPALPSWWSNIGLGSPSPLPFWWPLIGFGVGFALSSIAATRILRRRERMLLAAVAQTLRREDLLKRSMLAAVVERTAYSLVAVLTVIVLIIPWDIPTLQVFRVAIAAEPEVFAIPIAILLPWDLFWSWRRERRERRVPQQRRAPKLVQWLRRYFEWTLGFESLAIALFVIGCAGTVLSHDAWPAANGIFCASTLYFVTRACLPAISSKSRNVRLLSGFAMASTLMYGLPLGAIGALLTTTTVAMAHRTDGIGEIATLLSVAIPRIFAVSLGGAFAFSLAFFVLGSLYLFLNPLRVVRYNPQQDAED